MNRTSDRNLGSPKGNKAALGFIFAVVLLDLIGLTILIPVAAYIVREYSTDALTVTMLSVIYAAAQFFAAPILGKLSDRFGRRPVLLISVLGSAVGYFMFGIGGTLWVLFLSRLVDGVTGGNLSTAQAYITDITPPEDRAKNFALLGAAFGLGFILGPAIGGALSGISLTAPAFAAGVLSLLSAIVGYFVLPESLPKEQRITTGLKWSDANPFGLIGELMARPALRPLLTVQSLYTFVTMAFNSIAAVYLIDKFGVTPLSIAGLLVVIGIANVVVQAALVGRLVARFGEKRLAIASLLFQAFGMIGTVLVPSYWLIYPLQAVSSGGAGPMRPAMSALLANSVPLEEQGKLNGVSTALNSLMNIFGPLWAGLMYDHVAPVSPLLMGAIILMLTCLLLVRVKGSVRVQRTATAQG